MHIYSLELNRILPFPRTIGDALAAGEVQHVVAHAECKDALVDLVSRGIKFEILEIHMDERVRDKIRVHE